MPATLLTFSLLAAGMFAVWTLLKPAPPKRIVMSTGAEGGAYARYGELYAAELAKEGVTVELRSSGGSIENLQRLNRGEVDVALVQSGVAKADERSNLSSLGSLSFEPVWIVHRDEIAPTRLPQLAGLRVGVGLPGSGSRALALRLLDLNGLGANNVTLVEHDVRGLVMGVSRDEIDVAFVVLSIDAPLFKQLLGTPGVLIMDMDRALAYQRRMPEINRIVVPAGVIDLRLGVPRKPLEIVAASSTLVTVPSLHPAIQYLLWRAARRIHGEPSLLDDKQRFPSIDLYQEFSVPEHVERLYKEGSPILYRYLPFWLANLIYRLWLAGIAAFALFIAITDWIPKLFRYVIAVRVWQNYLTSVRVEAEIPRASTPQECAKHLQRVESLRLKTASLNMPLMLDMSKADLVGRLKELEEKLRQEQAKVGAGTQAG
ncbi:MAG: TAXI family TRAP transporter solute-binding subunit, partial [Steroidobacteraceae bacterium]